MIFLMNRRPSRPRMPSPELLSALCPFRPVPGCAEIQVRRSQEVFALWEAWEKKTGQECPVPFWAVVWPAAQVLARFRLDLPDLVRDRAIPILIGDGGRAFVPADYREVLLEEWVDTDSDLEGREKRAVILRY